MVAFCQVSIGELDGERFFGYLLSPKLIGADRLGWDSAVQNWSAMHEDSSLRDTKKPSKTQHLQVVTASVNGCTAQ